MKVYLQADGENVVCVDLFLCLFLLFILLDEEMVAVQEGRTLHLLVPA